MKDYPKLKAFIVHGHDNEALLELKNYLQNRLNWPEPIILAERASKGKTIIEKFEYYAEKIDIVFALFTPDDFIGSNDEIKRARQNVIFEFGYFIGKLGRKSGRVFMLYKKGVEVPTDLSGVIYIDITNGIEQVGEILRTEIESIWLID
jgi:predicted nucleotide-binding protein